MTLPDPAAEPAPKPEPLEVSLEYLTAEAGAVLSDPALSPNQLLTGVAGQIALIAPTAHVCVSGDFARSVQDRFDARGIQVQYGTTRGANVAVAKTMRTISGGIDIVVNADVLFLSPDMTEEEAHDQVILLLHLSVHEATHAAHHFTGEDSEATFNRMQIASASDAYYATEAGTIIEEYRAELAAELAFPHPVPFVRALDDDLASLSNSLQAARALNRTDIPGAARATLTAATNYWKALSLLAAYARATNLTIPDTTRTSDSWQRYGEPLWARWRAALDQLPNTADPASSTLLQSITREVMGLLAEFFTLAAISREWDYADREYMYWH